VRSSTITLEFNHSTRKLVADSILVIGKTADGLPHCGRVPGQDNHFILAGFNGAGMPHIFLTAKGIARMIREDMPFEQSGIPRIFKTTVERLKENVKP
jgi:hypothetical protein